MGTDLVRMTFGGAGDMLTSALIASEIEKQVRAAKRNCNWINNVPQLLEQSALPLILSVLQSLHPDVYKNVRGLEAKKILLAYWRRQGREKERVRFLKFINEMNETLYVDLVL